MNEPTKELFEIEVWVPPIATRIYDDTTLIPGQILVCILQDYKRRYGIWVENGVVYVPENIDAKDVNDLHIVKISLEEFAKTGKVLYTIPHQSYRSFEDIATCAKLFLEMGCFSDDIQYIYNIPKNTTSVKYQFVDLISCDRWNINCNYTLQRCRLWYVIIYKRFTSLFHNASEYITPKLE